jgi:excisionase family DNA binding protein
MPRRMTTQAQPEQVIEERRWLSLAEGAIYTGFSEKTLRKWISDGRLKAWRAWHNGDIRLLRTDLDALFQ